MLSSGLAVLATLFHVALGSADYFSSPREKDVLAIGDTQTIKWFTAMPKFTLALWQENNGKGSSLGPVLLGKRVQRSVRCVSGLQ